MLNAVSNVLIFCDMEEFTFEENLVVASAVSTRIRYLNKTINCCRPLGLDTKTLREIRASLLSAYWKLTGVDYCVNH